MEETIGVTAVHLEGIDGIKSKFKKNPQEALPQVEVRGRISL